MKGQTNFFRLVLLLTTAMFISPPSNAAERLKIYTVNYPLQYFAQRIAGEHAEVVFPAPGDIDPAFWNPDVKTVGDYQAADLILLNGANYARWIGKVSLPRRRLVDTSTGFSERLIQSEAGETHSHGSGPEHGHSGMAFTTWLDLQQAMLQAEAIKQALIEKRPQLQADFEDNFARLERDLVKLDTELKRILANAGKRPLLASHPVYQYLARAYGLKLHSVFWEPDEYPGEPQWKELESLATAQRAKWMIWEASPIAESVDRLAQMGIGTIVFAAGANVPVQGDFLSVMKTNLAQLQRAF